MFNWYDSTLLRGYCKSLKPLALLGGARGTPLSIEVIIDKVSSELGVDNEITTITTDDAATPYLVSVKGSKWKYAINQYTGEVLGERKMSKFFIGVLYTHRFLLDTS